jgi:transposase
MTTENNQIDFSNQPIFIGIDVHKKSWTVTVRATELEMNTHSMNPLPDELGNYLKKNYPGGKYKSVYEAGFCGYWIDRRLKELGIENIIVNPADVPTKGKERANRNDSVDSRKLARELENGTLEANYIPTELNQELRSLSRLRSQLVKDQTRIKNRIKSLLLFYGKEIPENYKEKNWSGNFIKYLEGIQFSTNIGKETLSTYISELKEKKTKIAGILKSLRKFVVTNGLKETISNLTSVPGIGFTTAITLYTELIDINRFKTIDELCSYVGLVPSIDSSGDKEHVRGICKRHSKFLRNILIESAWTAIRKDPALTLSYSRLLTRMSSQRAIIRITKKLLNRIRYVWKNNKRYEKMIVITNKIKSKIDGK